jgi:endonuclease-3
VSVTRETDGGRGGTYALVLSVSTDTVLDVGALGEVTIPAGGYAYVGSALGTGGFSRVDRHRRIAAGDHDVRHWHVDYLLGAPTVTWSGAVALPDRDCECALARELGAGPVAEFGASDCECRSHLAHRDSVRAVREAVVDAFHAVARRDDRCRESGQ